MYKSPHWTRIDICFILSMVHFKWFATVIIIKVQGRLPCKRWIAFTIQPFLDSVHFFCSVHLFYFFSLPFVSFRNQFEGRQVKKIFVQFLKMCHCRYTCYKWQTECGFSSNRIVTIQLLHIIPYWLLLLLMWANFSFSTIRGLKITFVFASLFFFSSKNIPNEEYKCDKCNEKDANRTISWHFSVFFFYLFHTRA